MGSGIALGYCTKLCSKLGNFAEKCSARCAKLIEKSKQESDGESSKSGTETGSKSQLEQKVDKFMNFSPIQVCKQGCEKLGPVKNQCLKFCDKKITKIDGKFTLLKGKLTKVASGLIKKGDTLLKKGAATVLKGCNSLCDKVKNFTTMCKKICDQIKKNNGKFDLKMLLRGMSQKGKDKDNSPASGPREITKGMMIRKALCINKCTFVRKSRKAACRQRCDDKHGKDVPVLGGGLFNIGKQLGIKIDVNMVLRTVCTSGCMFLIPKPTVCKNVCTKMINIDSSKFGKELQKNVCINKCQLGRSIRKIFGRKSKRGQFDQRYQKCRDRCDERHGKDTKVWGGKPPGFYLKKIGQALCYAVCGLIPKLGEACNMVCDIFLAPKEQNHVEQEKAESADHAMIEDEGKKCLNKCDLRPPNEKVGCLDECAALKNSMSEGMPRKIDFKSYENDIQTATCNATCNKLQGEDRPKCHKTCNLKFDGKHGVHHIKDHPNDLDIEASKNDCLADCEKTGGDVPSCKQTCSQEFVTDEATEQSFLKFMQSFKKKSPLLKEVSLNGGKTKLGGKIGNLKKKLLDKVLNDPKIKDKIKDKLKKLDKNGKLGKLKKKVMDGKLKYTQLKDKLKDKILKNPKLKAKIEKIKEKIEDRIEKDSKFKKKIQDKLKKIGKLGKGKLGLKIAEIKEKAKEKLLDKVDKVHQKIVSKIQGNGQQKKRKTKIGRKIAEIKEKVKGKLLEKVNEVHQKIQSKIQGISSPNGNNTKLGLKIAEIKVKANEKILAKVNQAHQKILSKIQGNGQQKKRKTKLGRKIAEIREKVKVKLVEKINQVHQQIQSKLQVKSQNIQKSEQKQQIHIQEKKEKTLGNFTQKIDQLHKKGKDNIQKKIEIKKAAVQKICQIHKKIHAIHKDKIRQIHQKVQEQKKKRRRGLFQKIGHLHRKIKEKICQRKHKKVEVKIHNRNETKQIVHVQKQIKFDLKKVGTTKLRVSKKMRGRK